MYILDISKSYIIQPLKHIFNLSINKGIFPDKMKIAIIKPIHKKKVKIILKITDPYHYYLKYQKYLKN